MRKKKKEKEVSELVVADCGDEAGERLPEFGRSVVVPFCPSDDGSKMAILGEGSRERERGWWILARDTQNAMRISTVVMIKVNAVE